jgi:two-component system NtrC family sensor kinase
VESSDGQYYLGIGRAQGPNWRYISVYPKTLLAEKAFAAARTILLAGLLGLAIELLLLARIIRRQVAKPHDVLQRAAQSIAAGELSVELPSGGRDELGKLTDSFAHMVDKLRTRDAALTAHAHELELEIQLCRRHPDVLGA